MTAICPVCGKEFDDANEHGVRPKRFCSPRCRNVYHCRARDARKRGADVGSDGRPQRPGRKCCVCGNEIDPRKRAGTVCCSDACLRKRRDRLRFGKPVGEAEYRAFCEKRNVAKVAKAAKRLPKVCAYCGASFTPVRRGAIYCSKKCGNAGYARSHREKFRKYDAARRAQRQRVTPAKPTADQAYEASLARVRAYLKLPARARWANRSMLTDTELRMAEQMWENGHGGWNVHYNTIR